MTTSKKHASSSKNGKHNGSAKPQEPRCPFIWLCRKLGAGAAIVWHEVKAPLIAAIAFGIVSVLIYVLWSNFWPAAAAAHAVAPAVIRPLIPHSPSPVPTPHPPIRHG
jgi:hypothetical protein